MTDQPLTTGNAAKLYCLHWIEQRIQASSHPLTILDLGCGTAQNFVQLLQRYPTVRYVGIEPKAPVCEIARRTLAKHNATIHNAYAYHLHGRLIHETFDVVVSFSVFEHVYRRPLYLASARDCLKPGGHLLINYDAGHFVRPGSLKERAKNVLGPWLARLGIERYYQQFVKEADFHRMAAAAGLEIVEARSFNTGIKGIHKLVPSEHTAEHMARWLEYELWLNGLGIPYRDSHARLWTTRNFILRRRAGEPR